MKRIALLIFLACQCLTAFSVDYHTAVRIASDYVKLPDNVKVRAHSIGDNAANEDYYIFNDRVRGNGFVIISGKDGTNPVLGYSDKGFINENNLPTPLQYFLTQAGAGGNSGSTSFSDNPPQSIVPPLVKTQWYQLAPYNGKLKSQNYFTCCVATAMAQVMKCHQWPERGHGTISYESFVPSANSGLEPAGLMEVNLDNSIYDWGNVLPTYSDNNWNQTQADAVATLMQDCGYASRVQYNIYESSAYEMDMAAAMS